MSVLTDTPFNNKRVSVTEHENKSPTSRTVV